MRNARSFLFLILAGLILGYAIFLVWQRFRPNQLAFTSQTIRKELKVGRNRPIGIAIPSIDIKLPIKETYVQDNNWPTSPESVLFVKTSAIPGEHGNAILYGHNWPNLLGNLPNIQKDDLISVLFTNGEARTFKVTEISVVSPNQSEVLSPTSEPTITLYTCTGFLDSQRFVVHAAYEGTVLASLIPHTYTY